MDLVSIAESDGVKLKKVANTGGGEYAGAPCPICGQGSHDTFHVQPDYRWPGSDKVGAWLCGNCSDRRWQDAPAYIMQRDGVKYPEALEILGMSNPSRGKRYESRPAAPPATLQPPDDEWREQAEALVTEAEAVLWGSNPYSKGALIWLHSRGFTDEAIRAARMGYNKTYRLGAPEGVVIPCYLGGQLWRVKVRRREGELKSDPALSKYGQVTGGEADALYGADSLTTDRPAVLVEGELNAVAVAQVAGDLVGVVATGSYTGCRLFRWVARLQLCSSVLVALDADEEGNKGAAWWLGELSNGRRWMPSRKDPNDILRLDGPGALRQWVMDGLAAVTTVSNINSGADAQDAVAETVTETVVETIADDLPAICADCEIDDVARYWPLDPEGEHCIPLCEVCYAKRATALRDTVPGPAPGAEDAPPVEFDDVPGFFQPVESHIKAFHELASHELKAGRGMTFAEWYKAADLNLETFRVVVKKLGYQRWIYADRQNVCHTAPREWRLLDNVLVAAPVTVTQAAA